MMIYVKRLFTILKTLLLALRTPTVRRWLLQGAGTLFFLLCVGYLVQRSRTARPWSFGDYMEGVWEGEVLSFQPGDSSNHHNHSGIGNSVLFSLNITKGGTLGLYTPWNAALVPDDDDAASTAWVLKEMSLTSGSLSFGAVGLHFEYDLKRNEDSTSRYRVSQGQSHVMTLHEPSGVVIQTFSSTKPSATVYLRRVTERNRATILDKAKYLLGIVVLIIGVRMVQSYVKGNMTAGLGVSGRKAQERAAARGPLPPGMNWPSRRSPYLFSKKKEKQN
eukprot:PhF_6_TR13854/c0_g1_i2/m.22214